MTRRADYWHYRMVGQTEIATMQFKGYVAHAKSGTAPWWWRYDPVLLLLIVVFVAFEVVARFHFHNANGWMTLSNRIVSFEHHYGWPARVLVYAGLTLLALHLWGGVL